MILLSSVFQLVGDSGTIYTPGYTFVFENDLNCLYTVTMDTAGPLTVNATVTTHMQGSGYVCHCYTFDDITVCTV